MDSVLVFLSAVKIAARTDTGWLVGLVVGALVYGWFAGRDRAVTILMSLYASLAIMTYVPITTTLQRWVPLLRGGSAVLACFLGMFAIVYLLLWNSHLFRCLPADRGSWWEATITGILHVGLFVCMAFLLLPSELTRSAPATFLLLFQGLIPRAVWFIAPIVFLYFATDGYEGRTMDLDEE
ncbi:MAG: hypothetical protein WCV84_03445 [Patescibacteria group bacterium]